MADTTKTVSVAGMAGVGWGVFWFVWGKFGFGWGLLYGTFWTVWAGYRLAEYLLS